MPVSTGFWRAIAIAALAGVTCAACECGPEEYLVRYWYFGDSGIRVQGQSLYPEELEDRFPGMVNSEGGPLWEDYPRFFRNPSEFTGQVTLGVGVYLYPPWCEDTFGSGDDQCARVGMSRLFVGPKREGEVSQVVHWGPNVVVPGEPAVYVKWTEGPIYDALSDFPEYQSTSAIGTATVLSEHPITITFDVEFRDVADQVRHVTTTFAYTGYEQVCHAYD